MNSIAVTIAALLSAILPADLPENRQPNPGDAPPDRFTFVRVEYDSTGGYGEAHYFFDGRMWERWETDYPEAEENFLIRIAELTTIDVNPNPISLRLGDERIFDYPMLYMCDVGWQWLTESETQRLRTYLLRGGFLWVDDFWGIAEWMNFEDNMRRVFPNLEWREIPPTHPILNMVFPLQRCPQVPAKIFWESWGETYDMPGGHREPTGDIEGVKEMHFRGLFDDTGRLMAVATHNSDIGDGWEREAESEAFFKLFSTKAYAIGINIVAYALTH